MSNRRSKKQIVINMRALYWIIWGFGTLLIILSWFNIVSNLIGWFGFILAGIATIISVTYHLTHRKTRQSAPLAGSIRPTDVTFTEDKIQISLIDGRVIAAPLTWYPTLAEASEEERAEYELESNGIYWPELEVDVSVLDVLDGAPPTRQ